MGALAPSKLNPPSTLKMRILCSILGVNNYNLDDVFSIAMEQTNMVADLKHDINVSLGRPIGSPLKLYSVNILLSSDTYKATIASVRQRTIVVDEATELQLAFCQLPTREYPISHIPILVEVPAPPGESFSSRAGRGDVVEIVLSLTRRVPHRHAHNSLARACCRYCNDSLIIDYRSLVISLTSSNGSSLFVPMTTRSV